MIGKKSRVLALYPSTRGFGYAMFKGRTYAIDWGVKEVRKKNKNAQCMKSVRELVEYYSPDAIILEDYEGEGSRRCIRIQRLINEIEEVAKSENIRVYTYSRGFLREVFSKHKATTKYEIAQVIAKQFPELKSRLPRERKLWMTEDARMGIFDAAALGLTFFYVDD